MFEILEDRNGVPYSVNKSSVKDSPSITLASLCDSAVVVGRKLW
jgi:hypothetical protein